MTPLRAKLIITIFAAAFTAAAAAATTATNWRPVLFAAVGAALAAGAHIPRPGDTRGDGQ